MRFTVLLIPIVTLMLVNASPSMALAGADADFDGNGKVGFEDFLIFVQGYGTQDTRLDLDGSGVVGFTDFLQFTRSYGLDLGSAGGPLTARAVVCQACHVSNGSSFRSSGLDVSPVATWRGTMMSYASKDPYWRAKVSAEVAARPQIQQEIESECLRCHAPLGSVEAQDAGAVFSLAGLPADASALDGVSCIACHKIQDIQLGLQGGMSGHFNITRSPEVYGPYPAPSGAPMQMQTGFSPVYSGHIEESALCASCHNLYTPVFDDDFNVVGRFPEQIPYSEWAASGYRRSGQSCQSCHLQEVPISTPISTRPPFLASRTPVWSHQVTGGNTFTLNLILLNETRLGGDVTGLEAAVGATREMLQNKTATLSMTYNAVGDSIDVRAKVTNLAGHRFPSAYPERRAWLHMKITDGTGAVLFESGRPEALGRIAGLADPRREPHHETIRSQSQVQIYEMVPADGGGEPTNRLLSAETFLKDNRLLPKGFDEHSHPLGQEVGVVGAAAHDADFDATRGEDQVTYRIRKPASATATLEARLYYQSVPPGAIEDLRGFDTPEVQTFLSLVEEAGGSQPEQIAHAQLTIGG